MIFSSLYSVQNILILRKNTLVQVVKKSGAVNSSNAAGTMSLLSQNVAALLEIPFEDQGVPHITTETSGKKYRITSNLCRSVYDSELHQAAPERV